MLVQSLPGDALLLCPLVQLVFLWTHTIVPLDPGRWGGVGWGVGWRGVYMGFLGGARAQWGSWSVAVLLPLCHISHEWIW